MGKPAARITDMHECPQGPHTGGPIVTQGSTVTLICGIQAARVTDTAACKGPADVIKEGSRRTIIGGQRAARIGDETVHGGKIVAGATTVLIGDDAGGHNAPLDFLPNTVNAVMDMLPEGSQEKLFQLNAISNEIHEEIQRDYNPTRSPTVGLRLIMDTYGGGPDAEALQFAAKAIKIAGKATKVARKVKQAAKLVKQSPVAAKANQLKGRAARAAKDMLKKRMDDIRNVSTSNRRRTPGPLKRKVTDKDIDRLFAGAKTDGEILHMQFHNRATKVRKALGRKFKKMQSAHLLAQSVGRSFKHYRSGRAMTILLKSKVHSGLDNIWKNKFRAMRAQGKTRMTVREATDAMVEAIRDAKNLSEGEKVSLIAQLENEVYREWGLNPTAKIKVPYDRKVKVTKAPAPRRGQTIKIPKAQRIRMR